MSNFKEIHPREGITLLAVKVPDDATNLFIALGFLVYSSQIDNKMKIGGSFKELPYECKLLGLPSEITEEQAREIMGSDKEPFQKLKFYNPSLPEFGFDTALEALSSFLEANGVEPNSVLLLKINQ